MPITKEQKREVVQRYADLLNRSEGVILNDNLGLSVAEMTELRAQIREAGGECHVIKNRLARLAHNSRKSRIQECLTSSRYTRKPDVEVAA